HQANRRAELALLPRAMAGTDAAEISTGKSYQLCWNLVGLAKLHQATGDARYLSAAQNVWESIREFHLTLGGGPWGGVGQRSREVFNHSSVFSPRGYVETCATFSWIQLNRELLGITGDAKYAEEIERSAYNDLLGAQAPNGEDWCYYSSPNGKRVHTTYWRCCKSSGAMALEELPSVAYSVTGEKNMAVNLYGPSEATVTIPQAGTVRLQQVTRYPFDGDIRILVDPERALRFSIRLRIPSWASHARIKVNGVDSSQAAAPGTFVALEHNWQKNDEITLRFPMSPVLRERVSRSVQESKAPDGAPISQEVMRYDYVAITRGPIVYATGLIDGFKSDETIRIPDRRDASLLEVIDTPTGYEGPAIRLNLGYRAPLVFLPYYEAGGRTDGAWRLTWMQVAAA
ncbi:MAG: beta-L-arabinofuranosidase domain-containing protein, partial [Steroidobacteraceae bacterium]